MVVISKIIKDILSLDIVANEALRQGIMNCNAYAEKIHAEVEKQAYEKVNLETVAASLRRLERKERDGQLSDASSGTSAIFPEVKLASIAVKSPLEALTFHRQGFDFEVLAGLYRSFDPSTGFMVVTQGVGQVTIVASEANANNVRERIILSPIAQKSGLAAITCTFPDDSAETSSVILVLLAKLAAKELAVSEVVSTHAEATFILNLDDLQPAFEQLEGLAA